MADVVWTYVPHTSSPGKTHAQRFNRVQFGDGYVQKGTDGINISKRTWSLQYDYRTRAEVDEMEAVLNSVGAGYLIWRIPPDGVVDIRWDFPAGWSVKPIPNTSLWTFTIVLEEVVG